MELPPSVEAFWTEFTAATGCRGLPTTVESFGDSEALGNELVALIVDGRKRATAGLLRDATTNGHEIPKEGDHWIAADSNGRPVCVCHTVDVRVGPTSSVDSDFAWDEGEGDRTRDDWLAEHRRFFGGRAEHEGWVYSDDEPCVFERFEVVWPPELADTLPRAIDLSQRYINLGPAERAAEVLVGRAFWTEIVERRDLAAGRLVMVSRSATSWNHWERHPAGEEVVMLLTGRADLVLEIDGTDHRVELGEHEAVLVPRGVWHRAVVHEAATILTITAGRDTEHRPCEREH